MTTTTITLFALLLATGIYVAGYLLKEQENTKRKSGFLILASFLIVLLTGLQLLTNPLTYPTGTNTTTTYNQTYQYGNNFTNSTHWAYDTGTSPSCTNPNDPACVWLFHKSDTETTTQTTIYEEQNNTLNNALATILMLVGFFGILETTRRMYQERTDKSSNYRSDE